MEKQGHIDLYYGDESGFCLTPVTAYAWQYKGEQIQILPQKSKRLNVFAMMRSGKELVTFTRQGTLDSTFIVSGIEQWRQTLEKMTVLVLDNAPVHQAALRDKLAEWQESNLFIFFLPKYSPHLNNIEHLWRKIKYEWLKPDSYTCLDNLKNDLQHIFSHFGDQYQINFKQ